MTTYTDVTNLPSTPASLSEADTHLSLTTPGINAQHYEWQGNSAGFWNPVNDDNGGVATATYLTLRGQKFDYDFDTDGGAVGNITLRGGQIPSGAIPVMVLTNITESLAGPGGTLAALSLESAGDLEAAHAISDMTASLAGVSGMAGNGSVVAITDASALIAASALYGSNSTFVLTADRSVVFTPSVHAITGGAFTLYIVYMVPA